MKLIHFQTHYIEVTNSVLSYPTDNLNLQNLCTLPDDAHKLCKTSGRWRAGVRLCVHCRNPII